MAQDGLEGGGGLVAYENLFGQETVAERVARGMGFALWRDGSGGASGVSAVGVET